MIGDIHALETLIARTAPPQFAGAGRVWLAFSGGLDSTVLLSLLSAAGLGQRLAAIHVHHGLQAVADDWVAHCERTCASFGVALKVVRVAVDSEHPSGPEAAAREARYTAFARQIGAGDLLVTAHHADDQAETFLQRALRGAGPRGLAGMNSLSRFECGWLWRPLLACPRDLLAEYGGLRGLGYVHDPHNDDPRYERSLLRRDVLPRLRERWPAASQSLVAAASHCREMVELIDDLAQLDLSICWRDGGFEIGAFAALSEARQRNVLRAQAERLALPLPPRTILLRLHEMLNAPADTEPMLSWPGAELRRYRGGLFLMPPLPPEPAESFEMHWSGQGELNLPEGCGFLRGDSREQRPFSVRFPRGGERLRAAHSPHRRSLKNMFQESGVPPWQRRRTPLLFEAGELLWVGGLVQHSARLGENTVVWCR